MWTDGGGEDYPTGGFEVACAGVCLPAPELLAMQGAIWGKAEEYGDARLNRCRAFMAFWGAIIWEKMTLMLFGLLLGCWIMVASLSPCHWSRMEILLPLFSRGPDTVKATKVKGHATDADVELGRVRLAERLVNIEADAAADLGRRHQPEEVMDVRRTLFNARDLWYPFVLQLHRFMVAISRVSVNHDGRGGSVHWG